MAAQKTVLVVEDSEINRATLSGILSSEYRVLEAGNGREALGLLELYGERIALILLDIVMPVMDGYTFLSIVKAHPDYASIPVIVTTQSDSEADEVAALSPRRPRILWPSPIRRRSSCTAPPASSACGRPPP